MPPQTTRPPLRTAASALGTSAPTGANRMAASSGSGGVSSDPPAHSAPDRAGERLTGDVAGPGESEHAPPLPAADLGNDVRRSAEAIDADGPPVPGHFERAPADEAGAKQRRGPNRVEVIGQREDKRRLGDRMGGVAAVAGITGEERMIAKVLAPASAIGAGPIGMAEPGHTDPRAKLEVDAFARRLDAADNLVPRHDRQLGIGQLAVNDMQVGAAYAAGFDPNPNLPRSGRRIGPLLHRQPFAGPPEDHGAHDQMRPSGGAPRPCNRSPQKRVQAAAA